MPVQSTNPDYDAHIEEWRMMDDALEGEGAIKRNPRNLPKPSGMVEAEKLDGTGNAYLYQNYTARAQYEHWVRDSLRSMMGLVSRLIPEVKLPAGLKGLEDNATADGFGLSQLFLRIVRQAISHGRVPLVVNIDDAGQPYFATYAVRNAINWDTADQGGRQDLSGLDESVELSVTGPSAAWDLGPSGSCGYLEFQGAGIEAVRTAMEDQKNAALGRRAGSD